MSTPSRPGVLSRFLAWADGLPGHGWWLYALLLGLLFGWSHGIVWATGVLPVGSIHPVLAVGMVYAPYTLAAMAFINHSSERALAAFWPATGWPDDEREAWRRRFLSSPGGTDGPALLLAVAVAVIAFFSAAPELMGSGSDRAIVFVAYLPISAIGYACALLAVLHTGHQLRLVARIHRQATAIDPFDRESLYAFSSLTVRTGLAYVASGYYTLAFNGGFQAGNVLAIGVLVLIFVIGIACFILPLWGIHDRLVDQKALLTREVEQRLTRLAQELYRRIDAGEFEAAKVVTEAIAGAADVRKRIVDVPTWPWRPQVLSGFVSALVLPVAVYLLTRAVANQLGA